MVLKCQLRLGPTEERLADNSCADRGGCWTHASLDM